MMACNIARQSTRGEFRHMHCLAIEKAPVSSTTRPLIRARLHLLVSDSCKHVLQQMTTLCSGTDHLVRFLGSAYPHNIQRTFTQACFTHANYAHRVRLKMP
jgi:hypothetical protein